MTTGYIHAMPGLPLLRGVPVIYRRFAAGRFICWSPGKTETLIIDSGCVVPVLTEMLCVDLDDPQGFGYVLRLVVQSDGVEVGHPEFHNIAVRHLCGQTTNEDRLTLAKQLRASHG